MTASAPAPSGLRRWIYRRYPSRRLRRDPLAGVLIDGRYAPVTIANWKLTPWMARRILELRTPRPLTFAADARLTLIIPFRDRRAHLEQLLPELQAKLAAQTIQHRILIVEQTSGKLFNRGKLINVGFHYAAADSDYYCIHDVDAIPVEADYRCPSQPMRLVTQLLGSVRGVSREAHYFSGAIAVLKEQVLRANGFSNEYWGWGKEDDDFFLRLLLTGCVCYADTHGTFHDLPNSGIQTPPSAPRPPHVRRNRRLRGEMQRGLRDLSTDGLTTLSYAIVARDVQPAYEKITVNI